MVLKRTAAAALALVILLSVILSGCGGAKPGSYNLSAAWCQQIADKIKALQPIDIPGSLAQDGGLKTANEFDVNKYFPVLTHLTIQGGYVLDYSYYLSSQGGTPVLYTRQKDQKPYKDYIEMGEVGATITRPENDISLIWMIKDTGDTVKYGNQIKIDHSLEGYYEYTVLQLLGGQFYLFYQANAYDVKIVSEQSIVENIIKEIDDSLMTPIDETFRTAARNLDLQPAVVVSDKTVDVSLVLFTKWGGFSRATFTMNRDYPHSVTKYVSEKLLEYNCGIKL